MNKKAKKGMIIAVSIILVICLGVVIFMQTPMFGKYPSKDRLLRVEKSKNYKDGEFQNLLTTPMLTEGVSYMGMMKEFFFEKVKEPNGVIPSIKTDLKSLDISENIIVWMGHSSYFMQIDGKKVLVDPVLSGSASPVSFTTRAYEGTDIYTTDEIPDIDYLFITHDHWDHLDKKTLVKLKGRIGKIVCPLGNGEHLEHWGFDSSIISEEDWYGTVPLDEGFVAHVTPARHFSGRGFKRNRALWASFVLVSPSAKIYIGGDSGYGNHFAEIGQKYGPFDIAILENGQYDEKWKYIHMMPHEVIKASQDLKAKALLPVHSGKFTLGNHDWDEPLSEITNHETAQQVRIITPMIGEQVNLNDTTQQFSKWWAEVE